MATVHASALCIPLGMATRDAAARSGYCEWTERCPFNIVALLFQGFLILLRNLTGVISM